MNKILITLLLVLIPSAGWADNFVDLCIAKKLECYVFVNPDYGVSYGFEMKEFNKNIKSEKEAVAIINSLDLKQIKNREINND